jgi:hypothetical protein
VTDEDVGGFSEGGKGSGTGKESKVIGSNGINSVSVTVIMEADKESAS